MELDEFLYNLHFDIDKVRPWDLAVDWADAPLPYKLYQDLPVIPLSSEVSVALKLEERTKANANVTLKEIGDFFWYSYGLTQLSHLLMPENEGEVRSTAMQMLRRYAPSGGALYPSELYAYLKIDGLLPGIYHYDVAHHRLVLLREGNFDGYLERALGQRCNVSPCFGVLFVSTMFWKNFYKYNNFAYRLQGLDAGALIGQACEVAKQCGYASFVYFQFLDRAINHLLGLREAEESVYAVIPLALEECQVAEWTKTNLMSKPETAVELVRELPVLQQSHYVKSQRVVSYPLLTRMNEAAMLHSTECFTYMTSVGATVNGKSSSVIPLPTVQPGKNNFASTCRKRYSPGLDFTPDYVNLKTLSELLSATISSFLYENDLGPEEFGDTFESQMARMTMACCVHGVEGLADGAYTYDAKTHKLQLLRAGDQRMQLQQGMSMPTVNLFQVPLCLHLIGSRDFYKPTFGYRGHRIQQMEVGMLLQRLLLSASALGMNGHPLLGYDEGLCDDIYNFGHQGQTCLIQVPVGRYRKTTRFDGALRGYGNRGRGIL